MARGEGSGGDAPLKSNFVERVVKLPMVHVAWDYATNTYSHIKDSNRLVNFTLTNAEKTATFVAGQAKPVVLKFEKQIQAVDDLACKGLGTLEEKVPFIKKPAEEIIGDTRKLYANTVNSRIEDIRKYGTTTIRSAADFGLKQATAIFGENLVKSVLTSVDGVLVVTQNYIDYILPPTTDEKQSNGTKEETEKPSGLVRLTRLSNAVRRRIYRAVFLQIEYLQEKSLDLFVIYPFRLIEFSKTNLDAALEYANKLWIAIWEQKVDEKNEAEQSQAPVAVMAVRNGAMWILGMLKLVPQLLPMYIYGLMDLLEQRRIKKNNESNKEQEEVKENGSVQKDHGNDHSHENNIHASNEDSGIDRSFSEENQE